MNFDEYKGKVIFVGAGPGAPDLITVRGAEAVKNADVIIYAGSLVNPAILDMAKDDAKIYDSAEMNLDEIIDVIKTAHEENKIKSPYTIEHKKRPPIFTFTMYGIAVIFLILVLVFVIKEITKNDDENGTESIVTSYIVR